MTMDFNDYFWGEKNNGFDVLYHNMKYGLVASKELSEFFRERSNVEELNSKQMTKLAKQAGGSCPQGTFAPVWQILKASSERLATLHMQMVQKVSELVKDVSKYADDLHKKYKVVKENESGTLEVVQSIQSTTLTLQKAKDLYLQKSVELDKLKKENASPKELEKAEAKLKKCHEDYKNLVEKYMTIKDDFERKMTLTCRHFQDIEEAHLKQMKEFLNTYSEVMQNNHDLVGQVHTDFKRQCLELTVDKLLEQFVLNKYTGLEKPGEIEIEELNLSTISPVAGHSTSESDRVGAANGPGDGNAAGTTVPAPKPSKREGNILQRVTAHVSGAESVADNQQQQSNNKTSRRTTSLFNLFISNSQGSRESSSVPSSPRGVPPQNTDTTNSLHNSTNPLRGSKWFLRSRRDKVKIKKTKKKTQDSTTSKDEHAEPAEEDASKRVPTNEAESGTPEMDEEGFCVQPKVTELWQNEKGSFYSSSDTDSDDERERKIHVEIKPLSNGSAPISASVDELRATVENLSIGTIARSSQVKGGSNIDVHDTTMKRSQSVSQQLGGSKASNDLLGLNLFPSPVASNASTPTSGHPYAPLQSPPVLQSPTQPAMNSPTLSASSRYTDLGDLFSEVGEIQQSNTTLSRVQSRQTPTPTSGSIALPRPPSRRSEGPSPRGHMSPGPMSRADSVGSLEFRTAGVPMGVSRGPSPLTIGMADTIPLAVAFHEIIHSYFRGTDESMCQVKMCGDMMLSFPAGIVAVLANNPNPAKLAFRLKNTQRLESIIPNKQLVSVDATQSGSDSMVLDFTMPALNALLKRQSEQNPSASYFNVDIIKYQVKSKPGASSCPFQLVAYWKCEKVHTDLKVDYKYNSHAMNIPSPLLNVTVAVPVDGAVKSMQAKPTAQWVVESNRAIWKFTELSQHSDNNGVGSIRARFELEDGPSNPSTISAQFNCEGTTLSGVEFELVGPGYRISLVKRRYVSGKYICDGDPDGYKQMKTTPPASAPAEV